MKSTTSENIRGVLAITWRSFAFLPWMLGVFLLLAVVAIGMVALPVLAAIELYFGLWIDAAWKMGLWVILIWAAHRGSLRRYFVWPRSVT